MRTHVSLLFLGLSLATFTIAQEQVPTPIITQLFAFACNASFSSCPDGIEPTLAPLQLSDGNLYGVDWWAGQNNSNAGGTDWKLTTSGKITVLHTFQPGSSGKFPLGENPVISLTKGADGNLYGVTESGGSANAGVMYKLTPTGSFSLLHNFCTLANCEDGNGRLILGSDGNFYGVNTSEVFRMTPQGTWSLVHALNPSTEGAAATLIQGNDGNLYGTGSKYPERGTIFKVTYAGQFTLLYEFGQFQPITSNLVQASDGNFYGAIPGAIFQVTPSATSRIIHQLTQAQGSYPNQLVQASDGNLWGLSINGGISPNRPGTVFALTLAGKFLTSTEFNCAKSGCNPEGMVQASDGAFYGTAITGGTATTNPLGTVFKINAGLPPPLP